MQNARDPGILRCVQLAPGSKPSTLFHFSEDPSIETFEPHVPHSNPTHRPAVWAIDEDHQALYWFPRDCPRIPAWPRNEAERRHFEATFCTNAARVHAIESAWLDTIRTTALYRYVLPSQSFERWPQASGQWVSETVVEPLDVVPIGDLLTLHAAECIDMRITPSLWPLHDLAVSELWDFSIVRMRNATPREVSEELPPDAL